MIYNNNLIRKMKIRGNELEILSNNEESFFDKYLNEVLYLFNNSGYTGIIFEDLDRFDVNIVFSKLREINDLINFFYVEESNDETSGRILMWFKNKIKKMERVYNWYSKESRKDLTEKIKFYYLIRDDVFTSDDRTKFFDLIIPVVPVLSRNNMRDKLSYKLCDIHDIKNSEGSKVNIDPLIYKIFPQKFLRDISYFISDKRLLNNIINEYIIYKNKISLSNIEYPKLLSIMIYKNVFPKDFNDLQRGEGYVHTLFETYKNRKFEDVSIENIKNKITIIDERINNAKELYASGINEILYKYMVINDSISVNNKGLEEFNNGADFIKEVLKDDSIIKLSYRTINKEDFINEIKEMPGCKDELNKLRDKKELNKLLKEKSELEYQKSRISTLKLHEIVNASGNDFDFDTVSFKISGNIVNDFDDVKSNIDFSLIKYIISNNYLDERTYTDYISTFYDNMLSNSDHIFVRSFAQEIEIPFNYKLNNAEAVFNDLTEGDYYQIEILNFNLLKYLYVNDKIIHYTKIINTVIENRSLNFINELINEEYSSLDTQSKYLKFFIESINNHENELWEMIEVGDGFLDIHKYIVLTLMVSEEGLSELQKNNITEFISMNSNILNDIVNQKIISTGIIQLQLSLNNIDYDLASEDAISCIYKESKYAITIENIIGMLFRYHGRTVSNNMLFTEINETKDEYLLNYISDNIDKFITEYLEIDSNYNDDYEDVIKLFRLLSENYDDNSDYISRYVERWTGRIEKLEDIENFELKKVVISNDKLIISELNILDYYKNNGMQFDDSIRKLLKDSIKLSFNESTFGDILDELQSSIFLNNIAGNTSLELPKYEEIIIGLGYNFDDISNLREIPTEYLKILLNNNKINMTEVNLKTIREDYESLLSSFITFKIIDYIELIKDIGIGVDELNIVLESEVEEDLKHLVIDIYDDAIHIANKKFSEETNLKIIAEYFHNEELSYITENYSNYTSEKIKEEILKKCLVYIEDIVSYHIDEKLLNRLYETDELTQENKVLLLSYNLKMKLSDFISDLDKINTDLTQQYKELLTLEYQNNHKFKYNEVNGRILEHLRERGWITNIKESEGGAEYLIPSWKKHKNNM